jgi:O-antigen/teichoic acid export membrane protein
MTVHSHRNYRTCETLTSSAFVALRWNCLGVVTRSACGFIVGSVLARLLGPKPFGQLAAVSLVLGLANQLADGGFSSALVQSPELTDRQVQVAFTMQVLIGATMMTAALMTAPYVAAGFHDSAIETIFRVSAPLFLLQALGQTATGLLKRNLTFRVIQKAQVLSYLFGYVFIGLPLAYIGAGVWSLVASQLAQTVCYVVQVYAAVRHSVRPCLRMSGMRLLWFGTKITTANIVNWSVSNVDNAFVGHAFGSTSLGLYSRAFALASTPAEGILGTCQGVLFASCCRAGAQSRSIRRAYFAATAAISMVTLPLFWSMAACAPTVVAGIYGAKWTKAVPLFRPLALAIPFFVLMALAGPILAATNHVEREVRAQVFSFGFAVAVFAISARYSLAAVAWAVVAAYAFRYVVVMAPTLRVLAIQWRDILQVLAGPAAAAIMTTCAVWAVDWLGIYYGVQPLYMLPALSVTGACAMWVLLFVAGHRILPPALVTPLSHVTGMFPGRFARYLRNMAAHQAFAGAMDPSE